MSVISRLCIIRSSFHQFVLVLVAASPMLRLFLLQFTPHLIRLNDIFMPSTLYCLFRRRQLRLAQLFLSEEDAIISFDPCRFWSHSQVPNNNDHLADETQPEFPVFERVVLSSVKVPDGQIGEDVSWSDGIWRSCSRNHDHDGTEQLRAGEGRTDMQTGQGLEQDHTQTDTLDGIENTEPEPNAGRDVRSGGTTPWDVETHAGGSPPHLAPSRTAETDREDGQKPRVDL